MPKRKQVISIRGSKLRILLAATLILSACSNTKDPAPPNQDTRYVDREGYMAEFQQARHRLMLPPGSDWETGATAAPAGDLRFAKGVGTTDAELHWFCAWKKEWLTAHNDNLEQADIVMLELEKIFKLQAYSVAFDEAGRARTREIIGMARRGDPSGIQADVEVNCRGS